MAGTSWVAFDGKDCSGCEHLNDRGYCEFTACIIPCVVRATIPEVKPQTNADRVRAMSDEELAKWIDEFWSAPWCPDDPPVDPETKRCLLHDGDCRLCILDWLREES